MWKEVLIDNDINLQKFVDVDNSDGCVAKITPTLKSTLIRILTIRRDSHAYIYEDDKFTILLLFIDKPDYILMTRCTVKWDYSNEEINPKDSLVIFGSKIKEYMLKRRDKKLRVNVFSEEKIIGLPNQHILEWYGDMIIKVCTGMDVKVKRYDKYWELEIT